MTAVKESASCRASHVRESGPDRGNPKAIRNGATPSHHPFIDGIFPNKKPQIFGYSICGTPHMGKWALNGELMISRDWLKGFLLQETTTFHGKSGFRFPVQIFHQTKPFLNEIFSHHDPGGDRHPGHWDTQFHHFGNITNQYGDESCLTICVFLLNNKGLHFYRNTSVQIKYWWFQKHWMKWYACLLNPVFTWTVTLTNESQQAWLEVVIDIIPSSLW